MKSLLVECHHCAGSGKLELPAELEETLLMLNAIRAATTLELLRRSRRFIRHTTLCNRLAKLEALGFAKSHKEGKNKFWRRK